MPMTPAEHVHRGISYFAAFAAVGDFFHAAAFANHARNRQFPEGTDFEQLLFDRMPVGDVNEAYDALDANDPQTVYDLIDATPTEELVRAYNFFPHRKTNIPFSVKDMS